MAGKKKPVPFVISYGDENYFLDQDVERGRKWPKRSCVLLDGDGLTDVELISICETRSFDSTDRVVVVDNAEKLKGSKALKTYVTEKDAGDDSTVLVVIVRSKTLPEVWNVAAAKGRLIAHRKHAPWETQEISATIRKEARRLGIKLAEETPGVLIACLGNDLARIAQELRKLVLLVGDGGTVTRKDVLKVVAAEVPAQPRDVAEAILEKDVRRAMNHVSLLYRYLGEGASVPITNALLRQVEKMVIARDMIDKGDNLETITSRLTMSEKQVKYHFLPKVKKHDLGHLRRQMKNLCKLDAAVKGPARSKRTQVELAVLDIAA